MRKSFIIFCITIFASIFNAQSDYYFQQDVAYKINITLDPQTQKYFGMEEITYTNNSPDELYFIWFHLYPNAYKNENTPFAKQQEKWRHRDFYFSEEKDRSYINLELLTADDKKLEWHYKKDAIDEAKVSLSEPLQPGGTIKIKMKFEAKFPKVYSRSGHWKVKYFQGAQWYPKVVVYDKYGWHPDSYYDIGEFYGEFGIFDVSITLPQNFIIDATGVLVDSPEEEKFNNAIIEDTKKLLSINDDDERKKFYKSWQKEHQAKTDYNSLKTVHFKAENVHDFAWFAGEDYMILQKTINDGVIARSLVLPQNAFKWRFTTEYLDRTLRYNGDNVGRYKYPKVTIVDGTQVTSGGMEYPMITLITFNYASWHNMLETVIAHEVGHNWFQGMLGSDERAIVFLDEGLNSFFEAGYMKYYYGDKSLTHFDSLLGVFNTMEDLDEWYYFALQLSIRVSEGRMQPMNMRGEEYGRTNYSIVNYAKAVFMLNALRWTIGEGAFDKAIKTYFERWHFKHPELDDFWAVMQEFSDQDLKHFRKEWMETTHYSDLEVEDYTTKKKNNNFSTEVFVTENGNLKNLPAPVYLITENNDTLEGRWGGNEKEAVVFEHTAPVKRVEANLKRLFFESDHLNNSSFPQVEFRFLDPVPGIDKYKISYYPYVGYEYFEDGVRLGTGFWAGNWIQRHYFLNGSIYYGTESSNIGYDLNFSHRFPELFQNYTNIYTGIQNKDGLKRISAAIQTFYSNPENFNLLYDTKISLSHVDLHTMEFHEKEIYEKARYSSAKINFNMEYRKMLWNSGANFLIEKSLDIPGSKTDYIKTELNGKAEIYLTKKIEASFDIYTGAVSGNAIPRQEKIFAGGNVDPKHENFVLGYRGSVAPLRSQSMQGGMGLLGYAHNNKDFLKNNAGFSTGAGIKFPYTPIIYGRVGALADKLGKISGQKFFSEAGIKLETPVLSFIFPIWVSDPFGGDKNFDFRFYFNIKDLSLN